MADIKNKIFKAFLQRYQEHHRNVPRSVPQILRKDRRRLVVLFADLGYTNGAEIGVRGGDFSLLLCQGVPNLKMICVDPWARYGGFSQERQDLYWKQTCEKLSKYNPDILRMTSMEAINHVPDRSIDFVCIDGDHGFDSCMLDIIHWSKKVRRGGIVAAHDYGCIPNINNAVDAYTLAHDIRSWYLTREACATAFWVNP